MQDFSANNCYAIVVVIPSDGDSFIVPILSNQSIRHTLKAIKDSDPKCKLRYFAQAWDWDAFTGVITAQDLY
jgi:hypothetical protein